ncbi:MAG: hypothetical protein M3367_08820 [Acidobacteriota bacterium]|nr:hypothetical protein [Acidobacteriota bacterium]
MERTPQGKERREDEERPTTSFRTTRKNRFERQISGKWERVEREDLPKELK